MKRREFLVRTSGAVSIPILLNGLPLKAFDGPVLHQLFGVDVPTDRVLVLIQLNGGNDGLNTVIPLDQYSLYATPRPNVAIPETKALKLTDTTALHPSMTGIQTLWNEKKVSIVQGVTYPNPNLSHFRSTDIMMSASDSNVNVTSGWLGRYLNGVFPNYPEGYPNASMPDPIAIQMSAVVTMTLLGLNQQGMGIALQDPESFYNLVNGTTASTDELPSALHARENVLFVREVQMKSLQYSTVIKEAADKATNLETYPTGNRLADQLKIVARLIAGGLKTRVYLVQLGGFDTHSSQVDQADPTIGSHAVLLGQVSSAVTAFQRDIEKLGAANRVVSMTFSEFGRRVSANLSLGTDHGTAAPMFVFGIPVQDGIIGTTPNLRDLDKDNLKMQFDFRQVYASVLEQWFGADPTVIREVLFDEFTTVRVIRQSATDVQDEIASTFSFSAVAPNPVRGDANFKYSVQTTENVQLTVFDNLGFHVATVVNQERTAGMYTVPFGTSNLPSGTYLAQLKVGNERRTQTFVVVR
ncbi:MAG: DUF1501 domain-containing protein [bacterium]|nr:DUF1501 domain-containing protein [bacterium]